MRARVGLQKALASNDGHLVESVRTRDGQRTRRYISAWVVLHIGLCMVCSAMYPKSYEQLSSELSANECVLVLVPCGRCPRDVACSKMRHVAGD